MLTEIAASAAETVQTASRAVGEAAKMGIEQARHIEGYGVNELEVDRTIIAKPDFLYIKETSLQQVEAANASRFTSQVEDVHLTTEIAEEEALISVLDDASEQVANIDCAEIPLTNVEREIIMKESGWSEEIVSCIETQRQYELYRNAELHETVIDGRKCLAKDIDFDYIDEKTGMTNRELMEKGRCPIDAKTGERIELHHMGQEYDSPFAELCDISEHRGEGVDSILHDKNVESWRQDPEKKAHYCNVERPRHWRSRLKEVA